MLRLVPVWEYWLKPYCALRAGLEYSHMLRDREYGLGLGTLLGLSFRFWRIQIDGNFSTRYQPSRMLPGESLPEWVISGGMTLNPVFIPSR